MSLEKRLNVIDLGTMEYGEVLKIQERFVEERSKDEIDDTLILVEHPNVKTRGIKSKNEPDRTKDGELSNEELRDLGIEVFYIDRGGYDFLHSPGQIVGYPIRLVDKNAKSKYWLGLQNTMIEVAHSYGINAVARALDSDRKIAKRYRGAWYKKDDGTYSKIGAFAVQYRNKNGTHVTMHGFAFNVNNDISLFSKIKMCGFDSETCISLKDILGHDLSIEEVKSRLLKRLMSNLGYTSSQRYNTIEEVSSGGIIV